ncbi:MAG: hypothetical protein ACK5MK_10465 [Dysgonomonas sp.]
MSIEKGFAEIERDKALSKQLNKNGYAELVINPDLYLKNEVDSINNNNGKSKTSQRPLSLKDTPDEVILNQSLSELSKELTLASKVTSALTEVTKAKIKLEEIQTTGDENAIQDAKNKLEKANDVLSLANEKYQKYQKDKEDAIFKRKPGEPETPLESAYRQTQALIESLTPKGELEEIQTTGDEEKSKESDSKTGTSKLNYFVMPEESDMYSNPRFSKLRFFVNPEQNESLRTNEPNENAPSENDEDTIYNNLEEDMLARLAINKQELESKNQQEMENDALMQEYRDGKQAEDAEKKKEFDLEDLLSTKEKTQAMMSAYDTLYTGISDLMGEAAANNEVMAIFSKSMALFNIGISTAEALGNATKSAKGITAFDYAIQVATAIGVVLTNIAKAKKLLFAEKEPKAPKFASGGYVSGSGSGTSDSIPALLSNGESVLTASATSMFSPMLSAFNQLGGGIPISTSHVSSQVMGEEMLSRAFAKAVQQMPNPVVSVEEINNTNSRVQVLETYRSL